MDDAHTLASHLLGPYTSHKNQLRAVLDTVRNNYNPINATEAARELLRLQNPDRFYSALRDGIFPYLSRLKDVAPHAAASALEFLETAKSIANDMGPDYRKYVAAFELDDFKNLASAVGYLVKNWSTFSSGDVLQIIAKLSGKVLQDFISAGPTAAIAARYNSLLLEFDGIVSDFRDKLTDSLEREL
jgi:hypothetical protein